MKITRLKECRVTKRSSRKEANAFMRTLHPEVDWYTHYVHHIDGNPLNNEFSNLKIVSRHEHKKIHALTKGE